MNEFIAAMDIINPGNWTFNVDIISEYAGSNPEKDLIEKEEFAELSKEAQDLVNFLLLLNNNSKRPTMSAAKPLMRGIGYSWKKIESAKQEIVTYLRSL